MKFKIFVTTKTRAGTPGSTGQIVTDILEFGTFWDAETAHDMLMSSIPSLNQNLQVYRHVVRLYKPEAQKF